VCSFSDVPSIIDVDLHKTASTGVWNEVVRYDHGESTDVRCRTDERLLPHGLSERTDLEEGVTYIQDSRQIVRIRRECFQPHSKSSYPLCRQRGERPCDTARLTTWPPDWREQQSADARGHYHQKRQRLAQLVNGPVKIHDINKSCLLEKQGLFDPKIALLRKYSPATKLTTSLQSS
jgi:hypothetical protein